MLGELYLRTLDDECMTCGWSSLGGGPHEGCSSHGVWTEESYSPATPADLVAHVVALPAGEARALLVALLRARPEVAVRVNGGGHYTPAKVAPPWRQAADGTGHHARSGVVSVLAWGKRGEGLLQSRTARQWSWRSSKLPGQPREPANGGGLNDASGDFWPTPEEAMAAADAALLADGWVLAGVTP